MMLVMRNFRLWVVGYRRDLFVVNGVIFGFARIRRLMMVLLLVEWIVRVRLLLFFSICGVKTLTAQYVTCVGGVCFVLVLLLVVLMRE
jgi:hypothetical protein